MGGDPIPGLHELLRETFEKRRMKWKLAPVERIPDRRYKARGPRS